MDKRRQIEGCIEAFHLGTLTEGDLRQTLEELSAAKPQCQDLLYLQTSNTSLNSSVHGMALVENGEISDGPTGPRRLALQNATSGHWRRLAHSAVPQYGADAGRVQNLRTRL